MPLSVKGVRPGPTDEQLLDRLAAVWAEAVANAKAADRLRARIARQDAWLDVHRDDPRWVNRCDEWRATKLELDRLEVDMRGLANDANKMTEPMDRALREQAVQSIHDWAALGGVGIYAQFFDIIPNQIWFEAAMADADVLRSVEVPF
jgi:hypothetical protein